MEVLLVCYIDNQLESKGNWEDDEIFMSVITVFMLSLLERGLRVTAYSL